MIKVGCSWEQQQTLQIIQIDLPFLRLALRQLTIGFLICNIPSSATSIINHTGKEYKSTLKRKYRIKYDDEKDILMFYAVLCPAFHKSLHMFPLHNGFILPAAYFHHKKRCAPIFTIKF